MHVSSSDQPCTSLLLSILPHTMTIWGPSKEFFNRLCLAEITLACILGHRCKGFVQVTESDIAISLVNVLKLLYFEAFKLTCPLQTKRLAPTISHLNNFFFFFFFFKEMLDRRSVTIILESFSLNLTKLK